MDNYIQQLAEDLKQQLQDKITLHKKDVFDSEQFAKELKFLSSFSWDIIQTIRIISLYSTRAKNIYDEFLSMKSSDDLLQSIVGIRELINNGIHNPAKRELRYLIEMSAKYLVIDQEKMGEKISFKT